MASVYWKYTAPFTLTDCVNDYNDAATYLLDIDHSELLRMDVEDGKFKHLRPRSVEIIRWILLDVNHGVIEVFSNNNLAEFELFELNEWCSKEQREDLSEGFYNSDFAWNGDYSVAKFEDEEVNLVFEKETTEIDLPINY